MIRRLAVLLALTFVLSTTGYILPPSRRLTGPILRSSQQKSRSIDIGRPSASRASFGRPSDSRASFALPSVHHTAAVVIADLTRASGIGLLGVMGTYVSQAQMRDNEEVRMGSVDNRSEVEVQCSSLCKRGEVTTHTHNRSLSLFRCQERDEAYRKATSYYDEDDGSDPYDYYEDEERYDADYYAGAGARGRRGTGRR